MIPKLIHQIWTDAAIPERFRGYRDGWLRHHPDWTYRLWTDADLAAFVRAVEPRLVGLFDGHVRAICRADIARYLVLKNLGGLYVDLDFECLRPLDVLLDGAALAVGLEPESHLATEAVRARGIRRLLCPSLIASRPGHAFWDEIVENLGRARAEADVLDATGPFLLTRTYEQAARRGDAGDIRLLPAAAIYPVDKFACWDGRIRDLAFREGATRGAFALHHWDGGWFRTQANRARELKVSLTGPADTAAPPSRDGDAPLVSCLMVTRGRAAQARLAVACFQAQTYPNRELVIVEDGADTGLAEAVAGDARIRHCRTGDAAPVLGRARNRAIALARGAYVCQWDDDDLYDPERLALQMAALRRTGARACLLARWTVWWPAERRLATSRRRAWEGSLLCERAVLPAYPELPRGEDTPVVEALLARVRVVHLDEPRLYLYVAHGRNTFAGAHFDDHWQAADARFAGARYDTVRDELAKRLPVEAYAAIVAAAAAPAADRNGGATAAARLLLENRFDEAAAAFEALRRREPAAPAGLDGLARVASRSGDWITAIGRWDELCILFPDHVPGLLGRGQALLELGRFAEARATFRAIRPHPAHRADAAVGLAETFARGRDWRQALEAWREVEAIQPGSSRASLGRVQALSELGDLAAAEAELRAAAGLTAGERLGATALLLQKRHRDAELVALLARHPDLVAADSGLRALVFHLEQGRGRAREALRRFSKNGADEAVVEALAAAYAPDADPGRTLSGLHGLWLRHGLAVATPDLLPLLVRAAEEEGGPPAASHVLDAVERPPLDRALPIRLNLIAAFERLRFDPDPRAPEALRRLADRCDARAPFGFWREAVQQIAHAYAVVDAAYPDHCIDSAWREPAARRVVERVTAAAREGRPLSLIRLGDGEGNFLDYPDAQTWHAHADREATQRIWWGEPRLRASEAARLGRDLKEAVRAADIVGVPDPARLCAGLALPCPENLYATGPDMRGLLVILDHLVRADASGTGLFRPGQLLTSCHIHADLAAFGLYDVLFSAIRSVAVLTCHVDLAARLRECFGLTVTRTIAIPHERKYGSVFGYGAEEQHYPDVFERLRDTLALAHPGEVVLVAAGFLGKLYCHWIRERGGIALDLGSIVDHWCGFNTRSLQFRYRYAGPPKRPAPAGRRAVASPAPTGSTAAGSIRIARDRAALASWDVGRDGSPGVNLFAEVGKATGIGRAGAGLAAALRAAGIPVHLVDPHAPATVRGGARLPYPINIFHLNPWSLLDKAAWHAGVFDASTFSHRVNVGCWAWESATTFPAAWRPAIDLLDEIWAPSRFTAEALRAAVPLPVRVVPHALDLAGRPGDADRPQGGGFQVGYVFDELSGFDRKNPLGLVEAFRRAFPDEEARLVLKARTLSDHRRAEILRACADHPGIVLEMGELSRDAVLRWIASCDAYVSLHRAEGFGLTVAEAMALGTPVIATAYSAVSEFLDETTGYPVPFRLTRLPAARDAYPAGTVWADPDLDAAALAMQRVREAPDEAAARAARARVRVADRFSAQSVGRQLRSELDRIVGQEARPRSASAPAASNRPAAAASHPKILVLTPVRNAAHALDGYFAALYGLDYPPDRLSVAFLEGDSADDSCARVQAGAQALVRRGHAARVLRKNFGVHHPGARWAPEVQRARRAGIARARNWLLGAALGDEDWVLWIDADVIGYPADTLKRLLAAGRDIVVPHCVVVPGGPTFDLNSFREIEGGRAANRSVDDSGLAQPGRGEGRLYLEDFRDRPIVELDAVGGSMLLVRADLHREGLVFPIVPVDGLIETEGFALMARQAGHRCWGLPWLEILHASA